MGLDSLLWEKGKTMTKLLRQLDDPELDEIKLNTGDHFELVYMRHRYFRKSTNPDPKRLAKFEEMICNISDKIYLRNIEAFKTVGFEMDDLRNIGRINTVSFISMSGLPENPDKMEKFVEQHKRKYGEDSTPNNKDIFLKECYTLAKFLNQRLQEVAKICKNKNTNIRGTKSIKKFYIGDPRSNPTDLELYNNPKTYGYKKITQAKYKKLVKENDAKGKTKFLTSDNQVVRAVYIKGSFLTEKDIKGTDMDPRNALYYSNPEEAMIAIEERVKIEKNIDKAIQKLEQE